MRSILATNTLPGDAQPTVLLYRPSTVPNVSRDDDNSHDSLVLIHRTPLYTRGLRKASTAHTTDPTGGRALGQNGQTTSTIARKIIATHNLPPPLPGAIIPGKICKPLHGSLVPWGAQQAPRQRQPPPPLPLAPPPPLVSPPPQRARQ